MLLVVLELVVFLHVQAVASIDAHLHFRHVTPSNRTHTSRPFQRFPASKRLGKDIASTTEKVRHAQIVADDKHLLIPAAHLPFMHPKRACVLCEVSQNDSKSVNDFSSFTIVVAGCDACPFGYVAPSIE
eukprot:6187070-Pleurochrysis_carterae.AAC.2